MSQPSGRRHRLRPEKGDLKHDAVAGIPGAISSVPDGMACAVIAGVNPIYGLYASITGRLVGGLTSSTALMVITTTGASALAAGSGVSHTRPADRAAALFLLTILAGFIMLAAGFLRLGKYARFVSHSVMVGFLAGVAVNIAFGQFQDFTGAPKPKGSVPFLRGLNVLLHPGTWNWPSVAVGLVALVILAVFVRTRIKAFAALIALAIPTIACNIWAVDSVLQVDDRADIPLGIPVPHLPAWHLLNLSLIGGAFAVAAIVLVQGVGVGEATPNPDGSHVRMNLDFISQGLGNVASGAVRGLPVGASVGQTAMNTSVGARSRWASIASAVWLLLVVGALGKVVGNVAIPTLAAVLIFASAGAIRPHEFLAVARTGTTSKVGVFATFIATLLLPVAPAVGLGVVVSLLLQLNREAIDLTVVELDEDEQGQLVERPAPRYLPSDDVILLDVYGSLFYAGAKTLESRLPRVRDADRPVVVLRLRGRSTLGATAFGVLDNYAEQLHHQGGRLYLSEVDPELMAQFAHSGRSEVGDSLSLVEATAVIGESSKEALGEGQAWLLRHDPTRPPVDEGDEPA